METGLVVAHSSSRPAWGVGGGLLPTPWPFGVSRGFARRVVCSLSVSLRQSHCQIRFVEHGS